MVIVTVLKIVQDYICPFKPAENIGVDSSSSNRYTNEYGSAHGPLPTVAVCWQLEEDGAGWAEGVGLTP